MPGTHHLEKVIDLINGGDERVKRMVLCTEDSVPPQDVKKAIRNIGRALKKHDRESPVEIFVRLRDHEDTIHRILDLPGIKGVTGFIIPKAHPTGFAKFMEPIRHRGKFVVCPIIEHQRTPDAGFRADLLKVLIDYRKYIDTVRIGGADLSGYQGLRRSPGITIYDTVIGSLIDNIVNEFRGIGGFEVTAPVFEAFAARYDDQFWAELRRSIANGLFGQTVIHPRHLAPLLRAYKVSADDFESATTILASDQAVEGQHGRMNERGPHSGWARRTLHRAQLMGVQE